MIVFFLFAHFNFILIILCNYWWVRISRDEKYVDSQAGTVIENI